ncbi:MAG: hypothetical protein K940chlam8_00680 [Chlamydiae bacterium]|nr:hypothetical protein [Chlamydiota bacterium]
MNKKHQIIYDLFGQIISKKVQDAQWCHGSIIELDFGMNQIIKSPTPKKIYWVEFEWDFWIYIAFWELEINGKIITDCNENGEKIQSGIQKLNGKKLLDVKVFGDEYDLLLTFEDRTILNIIADNNHGSYEQWRLFTPDKTVLTAGPFKKLVYKSLRKSNED